MPMHLMVESESGRNISLKFSVFEVFFLSIDFVFNLVSYFAHQFSLVHFYDEYMSLSCCPGA